MPTRAENWGHMQVGGLEGALSAAVLLLPLPGLAWGGSRPCLPSSLGLQLPARRPTASLPPPLPSPRPLQGGVTVWLNGPPALLAHRVVGDGTESRPLLSQGDEAGGEQQSADAYAAAVARLTALLEERAPLYAGSDITVSLEGEGPDAALGVPAMEVCARILLAIDSRIKGDAGE